MWRVDMISNYKINNYTIGLLKESGAEDTQHHTKSPNKERTYFLFNNFKILK
jgi:hypothetical protein